MWHDPNEPSMLHADIMHEVMFRSGMGGVGGIGITFLDSSYRRDNF